MHRRVGHAARQDLSQEQVLVDRVSTIFAYREFAGLQVSSKFYINRSDDGGFTYGPAVLASVGGNTTGDIAVDQHDGSVYFCFQGPSPDGNQVRVAIAPTYSGCPAVAEMRADVVRKLHDEGFDDVQVRVELDPPWRTDDITEHGRAVLAEHGIAPPGAVRRPIAVQLGVHIDAPACPQCGSSRTAVLSPFGPTPCLALCRCLDCRETFEHMKPLG